jgi:hypothetical protein
MEQQLQSSSAEPDSPWRSALSIGQAVFTQLWGGDDLQASSPQREVTRANGAQRGAPHDHCAGCIMEHDFALEQKIKDLVNVQLQDHIMGIVEKKIRPLIDQQAFTDGKMKLLTAGHKQLTDSCRQEMQSSAKCSEDVVILTRKLQELQQDKDVLEQRVSEQSSTIRELANEVDRAHRATRRMVELENRVQAQESRIKELQEKVPFRIPGKIIEDLAIASDTAESKAQDMNVLRANSFDLEKNMEGNLVSLKERLDLVEEQEKRTRESKEEMPKGPLGGGGPAENRTWKTGNPSTHGEPWMNPGTPIQVPNIKDTLPEFQGQDVEDPKCYIGTAERRLLAANVPREFWCISVAGKLKGTAKEWWTGIEYLIQSWDEFKSAYLARFDHPTLVARLRSRLLMERFKEGESVEQFLRQKGRMFQRLHGGKTLHHICLAL